MVPRRVLAVLAGLAFAATFAPLAIAATKNGIKPLSPRAGATLPSGKDATFKMRVVGPGQVYVSICTKARKNKKGLICHNKDLIQAKHKKKGNLVVGTSKAWDFKGNWLNTPGTYYWQAHRISCESGLGDCYQEGPVVKVKVR